MTSMGHFEAEALARSHVQLLCDGVQLRLTVSQQVRLLGRSWRMRSLMFSLLPCCRAAVLPRAVRVAEVDRHTRFLSHFGVPRQVVDHALTHP